MPEPKKKAFCRDFERLSNALGECEINVPFPVAGFAKAVLGEKPATDATAPGTVSGGYDNSGYLLDVEHDTPRDTLHAVYPDEEGAEVALKIYFRTLITAYDEDGNPASFKYEGLTPDGDPLDLWIAGKVTDAFNAMASQLAAAESWMTNALAVVDAVEEIDNSATRDAIINLSLALNRLGSAFAETVRVWKYSAGRKE